jgi:hypothetical protein
VLGLAPSRTTPWIIRHILGALKAFPFWLRQSDLLDAGLPHRGQAVATARSVGAAAKNDAACEPALGMTHCHGKSSLCETPG